ncbi:TIGR02206 family membrane protein [Paenibacillus sp. D51F]
MFGTDVTAKFAPFGAAHLASLLLIAAVVLAVYLLRRKLALRPAPGRFILAALLAACEILLNVWYVRGDVYSPSSTLPLELCSISLYLSVLMLLLRSRFLFGIVYFTAIGGALQALATPVLAYAYPHFRFLEFFIAHGLLIVSALYMVWVEGFRPTLRSVFTAWAAVNVIAVFVYAVDRLTGANYMFLARKPSSSSLLDVLGPYPWYILSLELVALLLFFLLYLPFARINRAEDSKQPAAS